MANEIKLQVGTIISWKVSGGDETIDIGDSTTSLADGVEVGAYHDWGVDPRPNRYMWFLDIDGFVATNSPVIGETVDLYVTESEDSTLWTGPEAPGDTTRGAGNTDRLKNLRYLGSAVVRSTTEADNLTASGEVTINSRYFAPVVHNNTADPLLISADSHEVRFYPISDEIQ